MTGRIQDEHPIQFLFALIFVCGGTFLALAWYFSMPSYDGSETIKIAAIELLDEFGSDEAYSTLKYDGEWLQITGLAGSTEMVGRGAKLEIKPVNYDEGFFPDLRTVTCFLSDKGEEQYLNDRPRGVVTLIGTFYYRNRGLGFEGCEFVY